MDDDDAQFLVVELAAGVNCQDLSETLGTQPFEHANYQWLVLGSTPAGNAVVAAVAGAEVAPSVGLGRRDARAPLCRLYWCRRRRRRLAGHPVRRDAVRGARRLQSLLEPAR